MASEKQIKELASKNKKLITDKVFFTSKTVNRYFQELAELAIRKEIDRYDKIHMKPFSRKTKIRVSITYDRKGKSVAYAASSTNNKTNEETIMIYINAGHVMFKKVKSREMLLSYIKGLLAHEISHVVNTDYRMLAAFRDRAAIGSIFPDVIDLAKRDSDFNANYEKITSYLSGTKEDRAAFASVAAELHNCGEDGYIEEATMEVNHGSMIEGLFDLREFDFKEMPTISELEDKLELEDDDPEKIHMFNAIMQVYLCYSKYGEFKYDEDWELESEIIQAFIPCIKDLDKALGSPDTRKRMQLMNNTIIILWPYIESYLEYVKNLPDSGDGEGAGEGDSGSGKSSKVTKHLKSHMKGGSSANDGCSTSGIDNKSKDESSEDEVSKKRKSTKSKLGLDEEEENEESGSSKSGEEGDESEEDSSGKDEVDEDAESEVQDVTAEEGGRFNPDEVDDVVEEFDDTAEGEIVKNNDFEGSGYDSAADDIERLLNEIATEAAEVELETSRTEELNTFGKAINYGDKHKGMLVTINRMSSVPEYLIDKYNQIAPPLIAISKQLQKKVSQKLKDRRKGGKETNLYYGHKIEARTLIRNDGRHFYRNKLPNNEPQMCVAVLLDESGSMSCGDRETYARATGLILYDFCQGLQIPVSVYGHTADIKKYGSLELNSYAEFNSIDKKDRFRIMDSCARDNNRDGAALKYMFEMLDKRPENIKILFVISDGQPYASGYSGHSAEEDMRTLVDTYRKRGVTTIAAAIGSDKPSIERIYGKDGFLDITDLNKLPVILTNILIKNLKL